MLIKQLLEQENILSDIKSRVMDSLIALKIQGIDQIETDQVLKSLDDQGFSLDSEELVTMLANDEMFDSVNKKYITFAKKEDDVQFTSDSKEEKDKLHVKKLAQKALKN